MRTLFILWCLSVRCVTERPHDSDHHPILAYIILHNFVLLLSQICLVSTALPKNEAVQTSEG